MTENYLTFERYREICQELGEAEGQAQEQLADYLHSLGIALNYRDDPRLRDTHVLNPHWVTEGIYAILNSRLAADQPRWRNGALLRWEQNYALVQSDSAGRAVRIFVTGPAEGRRRLLAVIRSADFLASDYCADVELRRARERRAAGTCRVVPVIVRDCHWNKRPELADLQALPGDGRPITTWPDPDTAWRTVADGLEQVITTTSPQ